MKRTTPAISLVTVGLALGCGPAPKDECFPRESGNVRLEIDGSAVTPTLNAAVWGGCDDESCIGLGELHGCTEMDERLGVRFPRSAVPETFRLADIVVAVFLHETVGDAERYTLALPENDDDVCSGCTGKIELKKNDDDSSRATATFDGEVPVFIVDALDTDSDGTCDAVRFPCQDDEVLPAAVIESESGGRFSCAGPNGLCGCPSVGALKGSMPIYTYGESPL